MNRLKAGNQVAFAELYDRYASSLLGVITGIVSNEAEAVEILEKTFIAVRSQAIQFEPTKQPLFIWMFGIARSVALNALKTHKSAQILPLYLNESGQLNASKLLTDQTISPANTAADSRLNELLNAVVFKNCTPEEAAASLEIPVEEARQQLRLAMRQLQNSPKS